MESSCKEFYKKILGIEEPYRHQIETWKSLKNLIFPLLLKAPTGSGKTEAVIAPFLEQFNHKNFQLAPRLIYVLPMRVLVNTVAKRIEGYAQRVSPFISVKVQHGDVPNSPFFIADIVVTTLDQFLYGFARASGQVGRHLDIPAGSIASSLIIFDEAHMYRDGFTFSIMRALMEILHKSRIPFVVMTATMPASLERSLFENISLPDDQRIIGDISIEGELKITIEDEPLYSDNEASIPAKLLKKMEKEKTLVVVNQVKRAQRIYHEIKSILDIDDNRIVLLHSRFTREDRKQHEEESLSLIPHKENGRIVIPEGIGIVVSTQVLEAGIDFSAELLVTELAPADSLIQRAGRCARYTDESGEMIIFPVEDNKGHLPYEKEHLIKAKDWLQQNPSFNIKDFTAVCSLADQTLDYQANDYEARDTLIDLYECVLYADAQPTNIQLRNGKPATLVVVEPKVGEKKREKEDDQILNGLKAMSIRNNSFDVDIKTVWGLFKAGLIKWELTWNYDRSKKKHEMRLRNLRGGREPEEEDLRIGPFRTYILEASNYNSEKGIIKDEAKFI
jgi:CRISPR-associated endonuclease/helicase Cas3